MMEEAGVNILYLALGHRDGTRPIMRRHLAMPPSVPVELSRRTASEKFVLRCTEDEIVEKLVSTLESCYEDFGIELPEFQGGEDLDIARYFDDVAKVIASARNWEVQRDEITLGFFSFAKFLMFRDLDPKPGRTPPN